MKYKKILLLLLLSLLIWKDAFSNQEIPLDIKGNMKLNPNFNLEYPLKGLNDIGIKILIEIDEKAIKLGLNKDGVRNSTELRLRREGIKISPKSPILFHVSMEVVSNAFVIQIEVAEFVILTREALVVFKNEAFSLTSFLAVTWSSARLGVHGKDPEFMLSTLKEIIDEFLNDYYKANPKKK